uniref:Uncharacterized protein n=3 Tax=Aegilops tauschii subsp. strangulata TaxID=200361 RepID=A0A453T197_AEGTS
MHLPVAKPLQQILDKYQEVFKPPEGLPPKRQYDHVIPLVTRARPISIRPYMVAPQLKDKLEEHVAELLKTRMIRHNN